VTTTSDADASIWRATCKPWCRNRSTRIVALDQCGGRPTDAHLLSANSVRLTSIASSVGDAPPRLRSAPPRTRANALVVEKIQILAQSRVETRKRSASTGICTLPCFTQQSDDALPPMLVSRRNDLARVLPVIMFDRILGVLGPGAAVAARPARLGLDGQEHGRHERQGDAGQFGCRGRGPATVFTARAGMRGAPALVRGETRSPCHSERHIQSQRADGMRIWMAARGRGPSAPPVDGTGKSVMASATGISNGPLTSVEISLASMVAFPVS